MYQRLAARCWAGEQEMITRADLLAELATNPVIPRPLRDALLVELSGRG
jgi:hypothetical protein